MITRKEKLLWIFYGAILVLLFLLSSTDLIIKEQKTEVYPLSVIIDDISDSNYVNFRKGMDRAAVELNADVSFISLYEENDEGQQLELLMREQQDGAKALIIAPVEEKAVEEFIAQKRITVPTVLVGAELSANKASAVVTTDYCGMGQAMAEKIVGRYDPAIPVYLLEGMRENAMTRSFEKGIRTGLSGAGFNMALIQKQDEETFRNAMEELANKKEQDAVIIALDPKSLQEAAEILDEGGAYSSHIKGLYGRGTTIPILNYLDKGVVSGVCVTDDFSAGYLSVKRAVEAVMGRSPDKQTLLESHYIEKTDLRQEQYEKMLYPIE